MEAEQTSLPDGNHGNDNVLHLPENHLHLPEDPQQEDHSSTTNENAYGGSDALVSSAMTPAEVGALPDDEMVTMTLGDKCIQVPVGAIRAGLTWPMPWEPQMDDNGNYIWRRGAICLVTGMPATLDHLYVVLHRFHDGHVIICRLWGTVQIVTPTILPGVQNLEFGFVPPPNSIHTLHESGLQLPSTVGLLLDTPDGVQQRACQYYHVMRSNIIQPAEGIIRA